MDYPKNVWNQIKGKSTEDLINALIKDGAIRDVTRGAVQVFRYDDGRRITIHYHPNKTYGAKFIKGLIDDIGWDIDDLRRLKLIK